MEPKLFQVIVDALGNKERSAKVYANQIKRVYKQVYKKELTDPKLAFLRSTKTVNYVKKIVNLTARKNAATGMLMGAKTTKAPDKWITKYREIMMEADKDYQKFLASGKRKRPFDNAEREWGRISELHKKVAAEIQARRLFDLGSHITASEYKVVMAWLYLKWIVNLPPRRLEYADTRLITKQEYNQLKEKTDNYVVMGKRAWTWNVHKYKTIGKYGPQIVPIPGPLKAALNRVKPIVDAKNAKGYIFQNNKFRHFSRSQFSSFVKWIFKTYLGKNFTQNTIRSIKISSVWSPKQEDPLELAMAMGHDVRTALLHYNQN